jgi:hypothetical protein
LGVRSHPSFETADRARRDRGLFHRDADLGQARHHVADRGQARHAGVLVIVDRPLAVVVVLGSEVGCELGANPQPSAG